MTRGGIAHNFNNLLTGILGNANLARRESSGAGTFDERLEQIEETVRRAAELCNQMLAYSGQGRCQISEVNLSSLVSETLPLLELTVSTQVELKAELLDDFPAVEVDSSQIRQIVLNLAG